MPTLEFSPDLRDAMLDALVAEIGTEPVLEIRTGTKPTNLSDAGAGSLLARIELPSTWMSAASSGVITKSGTWQTLAADAGGVAGHFRILNNAETTAFIHGDCTDTAGAGPMKLSSTTIVMGEPVTVVTCAITAGNADG